MVLYANETETLIWQVATGTSDCNYEHQHSLYYKVPCSPHLPFSVSLVFLVSQQSHSHSYV